ncbi:hypothetical protein HispidOSU_015674 [Sigmodon hispidus]
MPPKVEATGDAKWTKPVGPVEATGDAKWTKPVGPVEATGDAKWTKPVGPVEATWDAKWTKPVGLVEATGDAKWTKPVGPVEATGDAKWTKPVAQKKVVTGKGKWKVLRGKLTLEFVHLTGYVGLRSVRSQWPWTEHSAEAAEHVKILTFPPLFTWNLP